MIKAVSTYLLVYESVHDGRADKWKHPNGRPNTPAYSGQIKMGRRTIFKPFNILLLLDTSAHVWSAHKQTAHEWAGGNAAILYRF